MNHESSSAPESTAQRHAALPRVNGHTLPPIAFPRRDVVDAESRFRANTDNERWRRQIEQRDTLIRAAAHDAYGRGERTGYTQGWHWGIVCGLCAGSIVTTLVWVGYGYLPKLLAAWGL